MSKIVELKINSCVECPHNTYSFETDGKNVTVVHGCVFGVAFPGRTLPREIPEACPLEDAGV